MKKNIKLVLWITLALAVLVMFSGCGDDETETTEQGCIEHSFGEGVVTKEPDCGNEGERTFACSVCGKTKTESIPATGEHSFSEEGEVIKAASCNESGIRRFTCTVCGTTRDEEIPTAEGHVYDEGVITKEPTCQEEGLILLTCTLCGATAEQTLEILPVAYTVTMGEFGEFGAPESGKYKLPDPEKVGYKFVKWVDAEGKDFPSEGVVSSNVVITPVFELLETKTVDELEERAAVGAEAILIANDIVIDRTIYFTGKTQLISDKAVKLIRGESFAGDMIVVGEASDGSADVLANGTAELKLGNADGSSLITLDGNRKNVKVAVVGSAIFMVNSSRVYMYEGVTIANHVKVGNERNALWADYVGTSCTMGGAAVFIAHGQFDMYGGVIENNSVNTENIGNDEDATNYISSFGGAVYNFGTFNMYGGVVRNNAAVRGGAFFTRKQLNIVAGVVENNIAHNKGGAICTSESPYAEVFIGSEGAPEDSVIFKNNVATSQGGVYLGYHYTPIMILGGAHFEGNRAEKSVGGVIATAGPVTVRNSTFKNNYAFESGGAIYQYYVGKGTERHFITLDRSLFEGNEAGRGGVLLISASDDLKEASSIAIVDCEFKNNSAVMREIESVNAETGETVVKRSYGSGGVIYITKKTDMTVKNSVFEGNNAEVNAGAVYLTTDTVTYVSESRFKGNVAKVYGGALYTAAAKTVSITSCEFDSNGTVENGVYSVERGGAIYNADSEITTLDCRFANNAASIGGAVYIAGKGSYTDKSRTSGENVLHSIFEGNRSGKGGAVCVYGSVELGGAEFIANVADENGGAIYGGSNAVIVNDGCSFSKNTVSVPVGVSDLKRLGGAVYVINASLTVNNSSFAENGFKVPEGAVGIKTYGGAVAATGTSTLSIATSVFEKNTSDYGGAVAAYAMNGYEFTASDVTLKSNSSNNCGGAMYINNAKATLSEIVAESNSSRSGGAIYLSDSKEVKISGNSLFKTNSALANGGALFVGEGAAVSDSSSSFENNIAVNGGAVYINSSKKSHEQTGETVVERGEASFKKTTFINNKANVDEKDSRGGAVLVSGGILNAENVEFFGNTAVYYGGAITGNTDSTVNLTNVSFTNNSAGNNGGAIWTYFGSEITAKGIVATGNVSGGNGGVIYTRGDVKILSGNGVENRFGGTVEEELNFAANGGVIFVLGPEGEGDKSVIEISGAKLIGNTAKENGGALCFTRTDVKIENCAFEGNVAGKYGGALQILESKANISGTKFAQNHSSDNGGAIYLTQNGEGNVICTENCAFEANKSDKNGGAVYVTGTGAYVDGNKTAKSSGSDFKNNTAVAGGAIFVYGSAELNNTSLISNTSEKGGAIGVNVTKLSEDESSGEIVYSLGMITLNGAGFTSNIAKTEKENTESNGGAVYLYAGAALVDEGSVYSENTATKGGAIYAEKKSGELSFSLELDGATFEKNASASHGGAICVYNGALFAAKECNFKENKTEGVEANGGALYIYATEAAIERCVFDSNVAAYRGGAIYLSETPEYGEVVTLDCEFRSNKATDNGGAVYLTGTAKWRDGDAEAEAVGSLFSGNTATEGGAVMTHGAAVLEGSRFTDNLTEGNGALSIGNGSVKLTDAEITDNLGGVFVKSGRLSVSGETVIHNNTESNVYLAKGTYITVADELGENAKIGITAEDSSGALVKPDGEKITDASVYLDRFVSDSDMPAYKDENGNILLGYLILEQPVSLNNYTVSVPGDPTYAWHKYVGGEIGEAVEGQSGSTLTGVAGESYVCVIKYASGETLTTAPVIYAEKVFMPICGVVCDCDETHESVEFLPVTTESELVAAAGVDGNYYLYNDVEILNELLINADVTLNLNGKQLRYIGDKKASVIEVAKEAKLTLADNGSINRVGYIDPESGRFTEGNYSGEGSALEITLGGGIITGGNATFGGAIYVLGDLKTFGGNIVNNTAGHGGAIYIAENGQAEIDGMTFAGNTATIQGGAVRITSTSAIIKNSEFICNVATAAEANSDNCGGAIHIYKSTAIIDSCAFVSNVAGYRGGAIYATQTPTGSEIVTANCTFENNTAPNNGGAIYLTGNAILRDGDANGNNGSTFTGNDSTNGGAITVYGKATLNGSLFEGNKATLGGAIMTYGTTSLNGCSFEGNEATDGGAVYVSNGSFTDNSSEYSANLAENGGAVYLGSSASFKESVFNGNMATLGGAIYAAADAEISELTFTGNVATTESSETEACGGAIYLSAGVSVIDDGSEYLNNEAKKGGAVYLAKGSDAANKATYVGKGVTFTQNKASVYGGAVCAYNFADVSLENAVVIGNSASNNGGAFWTYTDSTLTVKGIVAKGNSSEASGGVLYTRGDLYVISEEGYENLFGGTAEGEANTAKNGGALYVNGPSASKYSVVEINGAIFEGNSSVENGGAVYMVQTEGVITDGEFKNNVAGKHGGALYLNASETKANGCSFTSNKANNNGGAIYIINSPENTATHTLGCEFTENSAGANGGAIYVAGTGAYSDGEKSVENIGSKFEKNTAAYGGMIFVYGSAELNNSNILNNIAVQGGAVYVAITENSAATDTEPAKNSLGKVVVDGATFASNGATVEKSGAENNGGAIYANAAELVISNSSFELNYANYRGGAIYLTKNNVEMLTVNSSFKSNTAVNNGGAVYLTGTAKWRDGDANGNNGSTFRGNGALNGGALMNYGVAILNGSSFSGNTATENGGAISSAKTLTVNNATFDSNEAVKAGGAIYATGTLEVTGGSMSCNKVTTKGDYIYMGGGIAIGASSAAKIKNVSFTANDGGESGGAIAAYGASTTVDIEGCCFESNSAKNGGAIYAGGASVFTVTDITAKANKATSLGAAIYVTSDNTKLTLNSVTFHNNNTASGISNGLAHLANKTATLTIYTDRAVMLDSTTEAELEISDWTDLALNPKSGTLNMLTSNTEG